MTTDSTIPLKPCPAVADTPAKRISWWASLEPQWRAAFATAFFGHVNLPDDDELANLWQTTVLRLVGPTAPYPNLRFELTNCSGLAGMSNVEILVITNHQLQAIDELATLSRLKSLFINNNSIADLTSLEHLLNLEQLYAQVNQLVSLEPLGKLTKLRELYVSFNKLQSLDGLTPRHARAMKSLFALPNQQLSDRLIMREERRLGIRIRSL